MTLVVVVIATYPQLPSPTEYTRRLHAILLNTVAFRSPPQVDPFDMPPKTIVAFKAHLQDSQAVFSIAPVAVPLRRYYFPLQFQDQP